MNQAMLSYPGPKPSQGREEHYYQLLHLAVRLTEANQAAFLRPDLKDAPLADMAAKRLPPVYWEAVRQVDRCRLPLLLHPKGSGSYPPVLAVPVQYLGKFQGVLVVGDRPARPLNRDDLELVTLLAENPALASENLAPRPRDLIGLVESIRALVKSLEARDHYTGQHSRRMTEIALHFAQQLGLDADDLDLLGTACYLHDIGKVGISDAILLKPACLSPEERAIIETHPAIGAKIVAPLRLKPREKEIILLHHERWDGRGYPRGLAGEEIPFLCRLVSLADVFDALTSDRPYRRRYTIPQALEEIEAQTGTQFDPDLARKFNDVISRHTG
jgi:putative nucleotidyltransferase with HDIG domain